MSSIVASVLAQLPEGRAQARRSVSRSRTRARARSRGLSHSRSQNSGREHTSRRGRVALRSRTRSRTRSRGDVDSQPRSPTPKRRRATKRSGTPPDARTRLKHETRRADPDQPPWRKNSEGAPRWKHGPPPPIPSEAPHPWGTEARTEAASREVVKFLRHSRPGPDGWFTAREILDEIPAAQCLQSLIWLTDHSVSSTRGPRLQSRTRGGSHQFRASPIAGFGSTPWERGARIGPTGAKARGPRSVEARARRGEASHARRTYA